MDEEIRIMNEAEFKVAQKIRKGFVSRILELRKAAIIVGDLFHDESHKRLLLEIGEIQSEIRLLDADCDVWLYRSLTLGSAPRPVVPRTWEGAMSEHRDDMRRRRLRRVDQGGISHIKDVG